MNLKFMKETRHLWYIIFLLVVVFIHSCSFQNTSEIRNGNDIIPKPLSYKVRIGHTTISKSTIVQVENEEQQNIITPFLDKINKTYNFDLKPVIGTVDSKNIIRLKEKEIINPEGYEIIIDSGIVEIAAVSSKGFFYGLQTLRQLFPPEIEQEKKQLVSEFRIQNMEIKDWPRFVWRGMMLDVSRHFFSKDEIKSLLDHMAMHKLNVFHWHLVDDQGWRIEIKKYPKLTDIGSWRVERDYKIWNDVEPAKIGEQPTYGGFYSQEDIKEIIDYASKLNITIVPEIEMPAHVMSAIASYPHLSCTGDSIAVPPGGVWPITEIYCPGKESTFSFLEDVLSEVLELFPSEYIHIGGDEATKTNWETCVDCQKRMKIEKLKNTEFLQAYMIERIEQFLNKKGRKLIGWDEILEGKLPPRANVMSWRGIEGGVKAAKNGHDVIMSPNTHSYFDYYQGNPKYEPVAFNKYLPIDQVYMFDPVPDRFTKSEAEHVLGGQANVWTEYIPDMNQLEYMVFPRIAALSEAVWTKPENKNWDDFIDRLQAMVKRYDALSINYAKSMYHVNINFEFNKDSNCVFARLNTAAPKTQIKYSINSSHTNVYKTPIKINESSDINASVNSNQELQFDKSITLETNHALGAKVDYDNRYSSAYTAGGNYGLVDGIRGSKIFGDNHWQGWIGEDIEMVIDLGELKDIKQITLGMLEDQGDQIFFPASVAFYISYDGEVYKKVFNLLNDFIETEEVTIKNLTKELVDTKCRYIKIEVKNHDKKLTQGNAWTFIDEIIIK